MSVQKTPPLGWPHTEAEKYAAEETRQIIQDGRARGAAPSPKPGRSGCGCTGGLVALLIGLAVVGVALALLVPAFTESTSSAEDAFAALHPNWDIETSDEPYGSGGAVRIVAWDHDRDVGRIVMMEPVSYEPGWEETPLLVGNGDEVSAEKLLDAFSASFASLTWSYIISAERAGGDGEGEAWLVSYQVYGNESERWSDVYTTGAIRFPATGEWYVNPVSEEPTPTP